MIIAQAEAWCNATVTASLETEPELCLDGARLLPQLLAEAKRLEEEQNVLLERGQKVIASGLSAIEEALEIALKMSQERDAWKAKAIEERAILKGRYLNDIITEIHDDWIDVKESTKMVFRKQASCELEEEMKQNERSARNLGGSE